VSIDNVKALNDLGEPAIDDGLTRGYEVACYFDQHPHHRVMTDDTELAAEFEGIWRSYMALSHLGLDNLADELVRGASVALQNRLESTLGREEGELEAVAQRLKLTAGSRKGGDIKALQGAQTERNIYKYLDGMSGEPDRYTAGIIANKLGLHPKTVRGYINKRIKPG